MMDASETTVDHIEALLDQALEATFPASDPIALTINADVYPLTA